MNNQPVIVDAVRTPMGKSKAGCFRNIRAEELSAHVMTSLLERNPKLDPGSIQDIIWGCVQQTLEQAFNVARNAQLLTAIPIHVPAQTVNRLCGSSMTAIHLAAAQIRAGLGDTYLVGGVEHMGHVPMMYGLDFNPHASLRTAKGAQNMGFTAELLAKQHGIDRKIQDEFALRSHHNAAQATKNGAFKEEIIPTLGHNAHGALVLIDADEVFREDTSLESLSQLKPVFDPKSGTITAGNASAISDGAAGLLILSEKRANELGLPILARIVDQSAVGCDPSTMGYGPVPAVKQIYQRQHLSSVDIDLFELNEAFAAQSLPVIKDLELWEVYDQKVNLHGGAIALGHPLGCSGARITTTLVHLMKRHHAKKGISTMCIGFGQGVATLLERG